MESVKSSQANTMSTRREEIELVEFALGDNYFAIDVSQVREIIRVVDKIVPVPDAHPSVMGVINLRGKIIPVVNLAQHIRAQGDTGKTSTRIIVSEFNGIMMGFYVSAVTRIHKIAKKALEMAKDSDNKGGYARAVTRIEERIVFLLDFERLANDINAHS